MVFAQHQRFKSWNGDFDISRGRLQNNYTRNWKDSPAIEGLNRLPSLADSSLDFQEQYETFENYLRPSVKPPQSPAVEICYEHKLLLKMHI